MFRLRVRPKDALFPLPRWSMLVVLAWFFTAYSMTLTSVTVKTYGPFSDYVACKAAMERERAKPMTAAESCFEDEVS